MLTFLFSGPKSLSMGGTFRGGMQKESRTITLQNGKITEVRLGHMKNALVDVLLLQCIQHPQVHSSYDRVLPT